MIDESVFIHKSSEVSDSCTIKSGTKIWHFSHIRENVEIGENVTIGQNVYIDEGVVIGDNTKIQNNVSLYKGGPSVVLQMIYPTLKNGQTRL